ncbi:hypothetical protein [Pseudomonas carnis]|uniref:hypothetical protein n=1 Tax=Pseudomonas carnis TaxID=2487355 RepID=UPI001E5A53BE|nr:hypothetical protein [Pseudomonas carnis]
MAALTQHKSKGGSWLACDSHKYLHNYEAIDGNHDAKRAALDLAFDLAFDLKRPVKPRWPNAGEVPSGGAKAFWLLLGLSKSAPL